MAAAHTQGIWPGGKPEPKNKTVSREESFRAPEVLEKCGDLDTDFRH